MLHNVGVALLFGLVLVGTACSGGGSDEVTAEDLVGIWMTDEPSYAQFNEDGSYTIAFLIEALEDAPVEEGQFTFDGTLFTIISSDDSRFCEVGDRGVYEVELLSPNQMRQVLVEDECFIRGTTGDLVLVRVP